MAETKIVLTIEHNGKTYSRERVAVKPNFRPLSDEVSYQVASAMRDIFKEIHR